MGKFEIRIAGINRLTPSPPLGYALRPSWTSFINPFSETEKLGELMKSKSSTIYYKRDYINKLREELTERLGRVPSEEMNLEDYIYEYTWYWMIGNGYPKDYMLTGLIPLAPLNLVDSSKSWTEEPLAWDIKRLPLDIITFILERDIDSLIELLDPLAALFMAIIKKPNWLHLINYAMFCNLNYDSNSDHILDHSFIPEKDEDFYRGNQSYYLGNHSMALNDGLEFYNFLRSELNKVRNYEWNEDNIDAMITEFENYQNLRIIYTALGFSPDRDMALGYPNAFKILEKIESVAKKTKFPEIYSILACMYIIVNRTEDAMTLYKNMESMETYDYYNFGNLLLSCGDNKSAITEFKRALELDEDMYEAQYSLGVAYMYEGRWLDAIRQFAKFTKADYSPTMELSRLPKEIRITLMDTIKYFSHNNMALSYYHCKVKTSRNLMISLHLLNEISILDFAVGRLEVRYNSMAIMKMLLDMINEYGKKDRKNRHPGFPNLISNSDAMQEVYTEIDQAAISEANVLITGETGTGKEVVARAIHDNSSRKEGEYRVINCTAIPKELVEIELFGYEKGAFTEASERKIGLFEVTSDGTLFLDEIGEISSEMQVKLLRAIEYKEFMRVGGTDPIKVNTRLIMATNRDLKKEIEAGRFREDLYYRINVFNIKLPPLRERKEDIPLLIDQFIEEESKKRNKKFILTEPTIELLNNYSWPGNVRQLKNTIESAANRTDGEIIHSWDLPEDILKESTNNENTDKMRIIEAYKATNCNASAAADKLDMPRSTFYHKVKEYDIDLNAIKAELKNK